MTNLETIILQLSDATDCSVETIIDSLIGEAWDEQEAGELKRLMVHGY